MVSLAGTFRMTTITSPSPVWEEDDGPIPTDNTVATYERRFRVCRVYKEVCIGRDNTRIKGMNQTGG